MPAIPSVTPLASSLPTPLYVCYFNQTQGLVSATNCSVAVSPNANKHSLSARAIVIIVLTTLFTIVFYTIYLYYVIKLLKGIFPNWFLNWRQKSKNLIRRILFWRPAPAPEPPSLQPLLAQSGEVTEPEPEPEPPQLGTEGYFDEIKKSCTPDELLLWDQVTFPDKITSGFEKIHLPAATIETVKAFGVPLLNQRSEFTYGVLINNVIPGLLLHGPPGTGKTQLVKALAKYCKTRVLSISAGHLLTKWFGESERAVATAFTLARKLSPCILFIDEADSMLRRRRGGEVESETRRSVLAQFLAEWDGFGTNEDKLILVVLATNRPSDLDDAVLRRAPKRIAIGIPTFQDRIAILKIHLQGEELDSDVSIEGIARRTDKFTGSDLKNMCIAAAYACIFEDDAYKTESEVPDKVEDGERQEEEIDVEIINLDGSNGEVVGVERHAENNVNIDDEEHGEDIPLLPLPSSTALATTLELPLSPPTSDSGATLVPNPPRRVLKARHFEKAIKDITPLSTSKMPTGIDHMFDSGFLEDALSQSSRSNATTQRSIVIPRSRVPF